MSRWATVLAGGSGTRFWPLSTVDLPKQFLPLDGDEPLIVKTVRRLSGLVDPARILVVTGGRYAARTRALLPDLAPEQILAEPRAASTAPALAWATAVARAQDPSAVMLSMHADWHVGDAAAFRAAARRAVEIAETHDVLVTVGIAPSRPEPGYGYIVPGETLAPGAHRVTRFVEKPDAAQAGALIAQGALWNSGLFAWRAERFVAEIETVAPELAPHLGHLARGEIEAFFANVTPVPVDTALFERSPRVAVVPAQFDWDDVGTWSALLRVRPRDPGGNVVRGHGAARDASNCVLWAQEGAIVAYGVADLVVVHANGVTLVTTHAGAAELKQLLVTLPPELRGEA